MLCVQAARLQARRLHEGGGGGQPYRRSRNGIRQSQGKIYYETKAREKLNIFC